MGIDNVISRIEQIQGRFQEIQKRFDEVPEQSETFKQKLEKAQFDETVQTLPPLDQARLERPYFGDYGVTSHFGPRRGKFHKGIDFGLPEGTAIYPADNGTVSDKGYEEAGYGNFIVVRHQNGIETLYAHLKSCDVSVGDQVYKGQKIALSGNTGRSEGPHLHFEVHEDGKPLDPARFLGL